VGSPFLVVPSTNQKLSMSIEIEFIYNFLVKIIIPKIATQNDKISRTICEFPGIKERVRYVRLLLNGSLLPNYYYLEV
jgi:hypothetical protein